MGGEILYDPLQPRPDALWEMDGEALFDPRQPRPDAPLTHIGARFVNNL